MCVGMIKMIDTGEYLGEDVRIVAIDGDTATVEFLDRSETLTISTFDLA